MAPPTLWPTQLFPALPSFLPQPSLPQPAFCHQFHYNHAMTLLLFAALLHSPPQEDQKQLQAVFETSAGTFIMEFYPDQAPTHVKQFIQLARDGFYNGTSF